MVIHYFLNDFLTLNNILQKHNNLKKFRNYEQIIQTYLNRKILFFNFNKNNFIRAICCLIKYNNLFLMQNVDAADKAARKISISDLMEIPIQPKETQNLETENNGQNVNKGNKKIIVKKKVRNPDHLLETKKNFMRAPSREFNNPIYAGLDEEARQLKFHRQIKKQRLESYHDSQQANWGPWDPEKQDESNSNSAELNKQTSKNIQISTKDSISPIRKIARPHAGFSFNLKAIGDHPQSTNKNKSPKNSNVQGLPHITQGTRLAFAQSRKTPTLHDIRYRSLEDNGKVKNDKNQVRNNFKIRMYQNYGNQLSSQRLNEFKINNTKSLKNLKMGKFVYNWGYDSNHDDCLLGYFKENEKEMPHKNKNKLVNKLGEGDQKIQKTLKNYWLKRLGTNNKG